MTATVLLLLSLWQDGQAATFTSDAITNMFPSQEGGAHCPSPTPRPTPHPRTINIIFFWYLGCRLCQPCSPALLLGDTGYFFRGEQPFLFKNIFFFFFAFPSPDFQPLLQRFPVSSSFSNSRWVRGAGYQERCLYLLITLMKFGFLDYGQGNQLSWSLNFEGKKDIALVTFECSSYLAATTVIFRGLD